MSAPDTPMPIPEPRSWAGRALFRMLESLRVGSLALTTPEGHRRTFAGAATGPAADLEIRDWRAVGRMLRAAEIGVAECWRDGLIATRDMTAFLKLCVANEKALEGAFYGNPLVALFFRIAHALRANTRARAQKNIHAHYDLGNDFYSLWLDRTMTYSSAWFPEGVATAAGAGNDEALARAQEAKYERMLERLGVSRGHHVLEIGCGWGGFAEYAVRTRGCRWTGITISRAQLEHATRRLQEAGVADRAKLVYQDYRDVDDAFDRIVSVEMIEAVGERFWPAYFRQIHDRLRPGGEACVQAITIDEAAFERYRRTSDFIREYIFPGGMLASLERFHAEATRAGLGHREPFRFGAHYAETLRRWRGAIDANEPAIKGLGFDERFLAIWRFYLHYCEAGFDTGRTDVVHLHLTRPA